MVTNQFVDFQNRIEELEKALNIANEQIEIQNQTITAIDKVNKSLLCTTTKVDVFLQDVKKEFIDPVTGRWITLKWYDISKALTGVRMLFVFTKDVLKDCYNVEIPARVKSFFELVLSRA